MAERSDKGKTRGPRITVVDDKTIADFKASEDNKQLNFAVAPKMYAAALENVRSNPDNVVSENGILSLKPDVMVTHLRTAIARYFNYTGDLVIAKQRGGSVIGQVNAFKSAAKMVFTFARANGASYGIPEDQLKAGAFAQLKAGTSEIAPNLEITDELLEALWSAADPESVDLGVQTEEEDDDPTDV